MLVTILAAALLQAPAAPDMADAIDWRVPLAQIDDAYRRWAPKAGESGDEVRRGWSPRLKSFPTKDCIQLWPKGPGGTPIYCYRTGSIELVEEHSETE